MIPPVAVIPQKFVALYHTNTDYCYTSFIVDYSLASCVSAIVKPRDFAVMILVLFCYRGLKIMELKNSFPVTFSALGINLQKFTIFPPRFLTTC